MAAIWAGLGAAGQASVISSAMGGGGGSAGIQSPNMPSSSGQTGSSPAPTATPSASGQAMNMVRPSADQMNLAPNQGFSTIFQNNQPLDPNSAYDEFLRRNRNNGYQQL